MADYAERPGPLYQSIAASREHDQGWDAELIGEVLVLERGVAVFSVETVGLRSAPGVLSSGRPV